MRARQRWSWGWGWAPDVLNRWRLTLGVNGVKRDIVLASDFWVGCVVPETLQFMTALRQSLAVIWGTVRLRVTSMQDPGE